MGRSAPEVETTWMGYTAGSRCGDKVGHGALPAQASGGGNKGEERGFAQRGRRAGGRVPKRKKKGGGPVWDLTSTQAFLSTPYYLRLTFLRCSSFLPFLVHNMRQPMYEVRLQHTCFLRNHLLLFTLREHYFINPLWISRSNTRIFVSKVVWRHNLVKALGQ